MVLLLQDMYIQLGVSPKAVKLLAREQAYQQERWWHLPGGKNASRTPDRGQQVSVIAQENLKLAPFHINHR